MFKQLSKPWCHLVSKKELIIRLIFIFAIGVLFPMIYNDYHFFTRDYYIAVIASICRTGALWFGSEYIVNYVSRRYDFFEKTGMTITIQVVTLIVYTFIIITLEINILKHFTHFRYSNKEQTDFYIIAILITLFITTIYASTFFFLQWKENLLKAEKLQKANLEASYETLKNQINPHFLFNSLNTLAGMLEEGSTSLKYVQNLSEFLRYVLQTHDKEVVLLRDELELSRQYSFIQQKRFGEKLQIEFNIEEKYFHYAVPPLSIQMLLENAIKHNVITREKPLKIEVRIGNDNQLLVQNNLQRKIPEHSTGIGLSNIRNRYKYLGSSGMEVIESSDTFTVSIPLLRVSL